MRWRNINGLPHGVDMKINIGKLEDFRGYCKITVGLTNNTAVFEQMNIEYPYIDAGFNEPVRNPKGVPEPFMREKK
ncbi:hypothetical protein LCGC14_0677070 [marine sediment metagenome]|uniref:Uncharacterized protein n=1 Tax=marine sediment metagenome TaxID=412755 RepID=A0A0F9TX82_9ZZZZ